MVKMKLYTLAAAAVLRIITGCYAASQASHLLWYSTPADRDFFAALPIGNGRLGAVVHGYTDQELIRLNEDSIWSGGPIDRVNPRALDSLPRIREQIAAGNLTAAGETWQANFTGTPTTDMRAYQPAGEMRLDFSHGAVDAADYVTWRKGLGTLYSPSHHNIWRSHFGQTAGSGSALPSAESLSAAVPEPTAMMLLVLTMAGMSLGLRSKAPPVSKLVRH